MARHRLSVTIQEPHRSFYNIRHRSAVVLEDYVITSAPWVDVHQKSAIQKFCMADDHGQVLHKKCDDEKVVA